MNHTRADFWKHVWLDVCLSAGALLIWSVFSAVVDNALIAPSVLQVADAMVHQAQTPALYQAAAATLFRTLAGLFGSVLLAALSACAAFFIGWLRRLLNRVVVFLQAVPNIAYIIVLLFWTGRQNAVVLVIFFLLFPMVYRDLLEAMEEIARTWKDVLYLYPQPWYVMMKKAFLPLLKPACSASLQSAASLAFKSGIMAEILASVPSGLGRLMQSARLNLNVAGVLGYVMWMLLLVFLLEGLARRFIRFVFES